MTTAAMSEWQNDWATYMPAKELKKVDMLITHSQQPALQSATISSLLRTLFPLYRNQSMVAREVLAARIMVIMIFISFIIEELVKSHDLPLRREDAGRCVLKDNKDVLCASAPQRL